jgi:hypothetical protein
MFVYDFVVVVIGVVVIGVVVVVWAQLIFDS